MHVVCVLDLCKLASASWWDSTVYVCVTQLINTLVYVAHQLSDVVEEDL